MISTRRRLESDRGAYAVLYAVTVVLLIGLVAIVIDLGLNRLDRRQNRSAADAAAIAGAETLGPSGLEPERACKQALLFAKSTLGINTSTTGNCATVFGSITPAGYCTSTPRGPQLSAFEDVGAGNNRRRVFIVWPVYDDSQLMTDPDRENHGSTVVTQIVTKQDGVACQRLGTVIRQLRNSPFATALGTSQTFTESRSVGLAGYDDGPGEVAAPLVVLDPRACQALTAKGSGPDKGGVIVTASTPLPDGTREPGVIQVDSAGTASAFDESGTSCQNAGSGTIEQTGDMRIWALDGNPDEGRISTFSTAHPYSGSITNCPLPGSPFSPITTPSPPNPPPNLCRKPTYGTPIGDKPWIYRYNCNVAIDACPPAPPDRAVYATPRDYVDQWVRYAEGPVPPTFANQILDGPGPACTISLPLTVTGDFYTDCSELRINSIVKISGKFVAKHDVSVIGGCLMLHHTDEAHCASQLPYVAPSAAGPDGENAYIGGEFKVDNPAAIVMDQVFAYIKDRTKINTTGIVTLVSPYGSKLKPSYYVACGAVATNLEAPRAACFEDLAVWSPYRGDNTGGEENYLTGNAGLRVDGTLFMAYSSFHYSGQARNDQARAQFVARILNITGGGLLFMTPDGSRSTRIPRGNGTLIR